MKIYTRYTTLFFTLLAITFLSNARPVGAQTSFGRVGNAPPEENAAVDSKTDKTGKTGKNGTADKTSSASHARSRKNIEKNRAEEQNRLGTQLGTPTRQKYRAGMVFEAAQGSPCNNVIGTAPVPTEFPEQQVRLVEETVPPGVKLTYRDLKEGGARQMIMKMKVLRPGQEVETSVLYEVTRYPQIAPQDTSIYQVPKRVSRELRSYIQDSPFIESDSRMIRELARETTDSKAKGWDKVQAIFQYVRDHVKYKEELAAKPMRGAVAALRNKEGDCEDMCALFIAMCRVLEIPARLVRVPGHCYAEFCLWDDKDKNVWFPAQVAGEEPLGGITDTRVILQKGDCFHIPESPRERTLYVKELFTGNVRENGRDPKFKFISEENAQ